MDLIVIDGPAPPEGEGVLWKAVEGEPAYRRLIDVPGGDAAGPAGDGAAGAVWTGTQLVPGDLAAPAGAGGLLMVGHQPAEGYDQEYNDWMNEDHLPALGMVPGVLAARRYRATSGSPPYFNVYHLASLDVMNSEAWKAAGSSDRTVRMREHIERRLRADFVPAQPYKEEPSSQ